MTVAPDGVVVVTGEVDAFTAAALEEVLLGAVEQRPPDGDLVVDLAGVSFLDSGGLNVFVRCFKPLDAAGRRLVLRNPTPAVRRTLELGGVVAFADVEG